MLKSKEFITVWKVKAGEKIWFHTKGNFTIYWGDDELEDIIYKPNSVFNELEHKYREAGEYTVSIYTTEPGADGITWFSTLHGAADKLIDVKQFGDSKWESTSEMFAGAKEMKMSATDSPNLKNVKTMSGMFADCEKFNGAIGDWDLSTVEEVGYMLSNTTAFVQYLGGLKINPNVNTGNMFGRDHDFSKNKSLTEYNENSFRSYWNAVSGQIISLDVKGSFTIDWGDGTVYTIKQIKGKQDGFYEIAHRYTTTGTYIVHISNGDHIKEIEKRYSASPLKS